MIEGMDTGRMAELEMRVKALEADAEMLRKRTVELSRVYAEQSATLLEVANLGEATAAAVARLSSGM